MSAEIHPGELREKMKERGGGNQPVHIGWLAGNDARACQIASVGASVSGTDETAGLGVCGGQSQQLRLVHRVCPPKVPRVCSRRGAFLAGSVGALRGATGPGLERCARVRRDGTAAGGGRRGRTISFMFMFEISPRSSGAAMPMRPILSLYELNLLRFGDPLRLRLRPPPNSPLRCISATSCIYTHPPASPPR